MRIGEVLKDWRLMEKLTLREVAPLTGIPVPTLQRIEQNAGKGIDGETMLKLVTFLFSGDGS